MKDFLTWLIENIDRKLIKEGSYFLIIIILLGFLGYFVKSMQNEAIGAIKDQTTVNQHTNDVLRDLTAAVVKNNDLNERTIQFIGLRK